MDLNEYFEKVLTFSSQEEFSSEIIQAKIEYFNRMGKVNETDPSYEMRMNQFLEWYVFRRPLNSYGNPPVRLYYERFAKNMSDQEAEVYRGFLNSIHSLFQVKKVEKDGLFVKDLFTDRRYSVECDVPGGFPRNLLFEGRIIPVGDRFWFSNAFCFHPEEAQKFILTELKKLRKEELEDITPFLQRLSVLKLKYDRYKKADAKQFYK